ncbi:hypothetical protein K490DRAFT_59671 [Saccharata proteae CBS 121410]|uniref:Uncharacterized protein n=1 Tax=Saccharata proteae CBS 121410 TaxID=1314787 RepID=A0A9P4LVT0_9PEZI|nr:hypothetical protein K490DRAFT_59671 [Saccharata proteae CBS 121410]
MADYDTVADGILEDYDITDTVADDNLKDYGTTADTFADDILTDYITTDIDPVLTAFDSTSITEDEMATKTAIGDSDFENAYLKPRNLEYYENPPENRTIRAQLELNKLPSPISKQYTTDGYVQNVRVTDFYKDTPGLENSTIWVEPTAKLVELAGEE